MLLSMQLGTTAPARRPRPSAAALAPGNEHVVGRGIEDRSGRRQASRAQHAACCFAWLAEASVRCSPGRRARGSSYAKAGGPTTGALASAGKHHGGRPALGFLAGLLVPARASRTRSWGRWPTGSRSSPRTPATRRRSAASKSRSPPRSQRQRPPATRARSTASNCRQRERERQLPERLTPRPFNARLRRPAPRAIAQDRCR
jgi:hypothetical protein